MSASKLIRQIVDLRFVCQKRQIPEVGNRAYFTAAKKEAYEILKSSTEPGSILGVHHTRGQMKALVQIRRGHSFLKLKGHWQLKIFCDWEDERALEWTRGFILRHRQLFKSHPFSGFMEAGLWSLLPDFEKIGLNADAIFISGRTEVMKQRSGALQPWPEGISIRRIRKKDISEVLEIMRREFTRNPQFGWFVATPQFIAKTKKALLSDCLRKKPLDYVILKDEKIIGHFGMHISNPHPIGFKAGSLGLELDQKYQKFGLSRPIYAEVFKLLQLHRVSFFFGATSQPGVMKVGAELGREMIGFNISSRKPYFPNDYFLKYPVWPKGIKNPPTL